MLILTEVGTELLHNFMDDYSLVAADLNFCSAINFTYERDDCAVRSWPDHIICSMSMANLIDDVSKFDQGVHLSDHYPLGFNFKVFCGTSLPPSPPPSVSTSHTLHLTGLEPFLFTFIIIMHLCYIILHNYLMLLFPAVILIAMSIIVH